MKHKQPPCSSTTPRIPPSNRLKLVCSSHGRFHRRPFDGKLRYTGGESRIISVDPTTLTYSYLRATIAKVCKPESSGFTLKYMLPGGGYDGDGLLVLLACDDDVKCMVEEFESMESYGKISRLWLYVFDGRDDDHGFYDDDSDSKDHGSLKVDDLGSGFGDLRLDMGFRDEKMMGYVKGGFDRNGIGEGFVRRDGVDGRRVSDNSLRKMGFNGRDDGCDGDSDGSLKDDDLGSGFGDLRLGSRGEKMMGFGKGDFGSNGFGRRVSDNCLRKVVSNGKNYVDLRLNSGFRGEKMVGCVKGDYGRNGIGKGFVSRDGVNGRRVSDNSLRKLVLKQQLLLARKKIHVNNNECGDPVVNLGTKAGDDVNSNGLGHIQPLNPVDHNLVEVKSPPLESSMVNSGQGVVVDSVMKQGLGFTERVLSKYFNRENILPSSQEWGALNSQLSCGRNQAAAKPEMHKSFHRGLRVSDRHCNIDSTQFGSNVVRTSRVVHPSHDEMDFSVEPSGDKDKHSKATTKGQSRSLDANFSVVNMDSQNAERVASGVTNSNSKNPYGKLMHVEGISELIDIAACNGNALLSVNDVMAQSAQEEMQDLSHATLNVSDNGDESRCHKTLSVPNGMPGNLASFYSHLATRELQLIKGSDLEYIKELGSGNYGTVYYGKWKGCDVAIKKIRATCFRDDSKDDRLVADFWKEADKLGQLHHPNIIAFYGVVSEGPITKLATVTEYMINGSLKQVLQRKDRTIDRRKQLIIAMDAALGMQYLHEKNIVHFDLKSHNLLVNMRDPERPVCKIGDLGLSKIKQRTLVSGGVRGTIPWMAPELLSTTTNLVTEKVDVYSFGIVMWELLTGEEPYANMRSREIIGGIMKGTLRPEIPCWCEPAWRSLMERCWSSDPKSRPSFSEVAKELRAMSADMNLK